MRHPNFERAKAYALGRLTHELAPVLTYHSLGHTRDDVLPAAERLAEIEGINGEELLLLRVAALFHDIGFIEHSSSHEERGIRIMCGVLPDFGFSPGQIEVISNIIRATKIPQSPHSLLEELIADADLDVFGREDFLERNAHLRMELTALGGSFTDEKWFEGQIRFMESHTYFSSAANKLRGETKRRNIERMRSFLEQARNGHLI